MAEARVFLDFEPVWPNLSSRFAARVGVVGAIGSADTSIGAVQRWLLGGYVEGCPWRVGTTRFGLQPCLDFELGASGASHRDRTRFGDSTWWLTPGAALRAHVGLPYRLRLEAGAGVQVPLVRGEVFAGASSPLYRAEIVLLRANLGVSVSLP